VTLINSHHKLTSCKSIFEGQALNRELNMIHTPTNISIEVIRIIKEKTRLHSVTAIHFNQTIEQLGGDSLTEVEVTMALESFFNIEISDAELNHTKTIQDFVNLIMEKLHEPSTKSS
jgi:acyl carrier protein